MYASSETYVPGSNGFAPVARSAFDGTYGENVLQGRECQVRTNPDCRKGPLWRHLREKRIEEARGGLVVLPVKTGTG